MNEQFLINYIYHDEHGYTKTKEINALKKLLSVSESFEDAKFTHEACLGAMAPWDDRFVIAKGALALAYKTAKTFEDYLYVVMHSVKNAPIYNNAVGKAESKAKSQNDLERLARVMGGNKNV